jgi:transcription initiation factor TFIIIB Brf1 subunit/transcription initiation factor TFIIB
MMRSDRRDYPDCPECETDVFVEGYSGIESHVCRSCGATFDAEVVDDGRRPKWVISR